MRIKTFEEFQTEVSSMHQDGDYTGAIELISTKKEEFPSKYGLINYWLITLYTLSGDSEFALNVFKQTLAAGFWYSDFLLLQNMDLKALQGLEKFENLVKINNENRALDESHLFPLLILRTEGACQSTDSPCPLLLTIHANAATAADSLDFWRSASEMGYLIAAPQSSQALWKGAYVWEDLEASVSEILVHFKSIIEKYEIDQEEIIISGIKQGAELCVKLALSGLIQAKGFILINPDLSFITRFDLFSFAKESNIRDSDQKEFILRGYIISGASIESKLENNQELFIDSMLDLGIICGSDVIPDAGSGYMPEYDSHLLNAIDFINQV